MLRRNGNRGRAPESRPGGLHALLLLNGALLVVLGAVTFAPLAGAQVRPRGTYAMVAGGVNGANSAALYVVDTTNQELIALTYNASTRQVDGIGYRNLAADAASLGRAGPSR